MTIVPASIRNRNPGAMYPGPSSKKFGSSSFETLTSRDGVHKIATFRSDVQGGSALFDLLASKYVGLTVEKAITRWCGEFYVSTYIKVLEEHGGVKSSDILTKEMLEDPEKAIPLAKAMALQEAGREYPMTDEQWAQAHSCAFLQPVAPAFAPDNDVPSPKQETRTAAKVQKVVDVAKVALPVAGVGGVATNQATDVIAGIKSAGGAFSDFYAWAVANPKIAVPGFILVVLPLLMQLPAVQAYLPKK
jgi:hypothetical protein